MSLYDRLFAHQGSTMIDIGQFMNLVNANGLDMIEQAAITTAFNLTAAEENEAAEIINCVFADPPVISLTAAESALWSGYAGLKTEAEVKLLLDPAHVYIP